MERNPALMAMAGGIVLLVLIAIPVIPWAMTSRAPEAPEAAPEPAVEVVRAGQSVLGAAGGEADRVSARRESTREPEPGDVPRVRTVPVIEISIEAVDELRRDSATAAPDAATDAVSLTADGDVIVSEALERGLRRGRDADSVTLLDEVSGLDDVQAIIIEHVTYTGRGRAGERHRTMLSGSSSISMLHDAPAAIVVNEDEALLDIIPWPAGTWAISNDGLDVATPNGSVHIAPGEVASMGPIAADVTLRSQQGGVEVVRGRVTFTTTATVEYHGRLPVSVRDE